MGKQVKKLRKKLFEAAKEDNVVVVRELLGESSSNDVKSLLSVTDGEGNNVLHKAAASGSTATVGFLLNEHFDSFALHDRKKYAKTPLHEAATNGHLEVVKLLVGHGVLVDCHTTRGRTPLIYASSKGHTDIMTFLLDNKANVNERSETGLTSVYVASRDGHLDAVKLLVDYGADVNITSQIHHSPLHAAVAGNHIDIAAFLIDRGARTDVCDLTGVSIWHEAAGYGSVEMLELFIAKKIQFDSSIDKIMSRHPFHYAAVEGNHLFLKAMLDFKIVDVNLQDADGCTALYYASANGHKDCVEFLLTEGLADVNLCSIRRSPLHCAVEWQREGCVSLLLKYGAKISCLDSYGKSPIDISQDNSFFKIESMLKQNLLE